MGIPCLTPGLGVKWEVKYKEGRKEIGQGRKEKEGEQRGRGQSFFTEQHILHLNLDISWNNHFVICECLELSCSCC